MEFIMKKIKCILISLLTLMVTSSVSFSSEILKLPATVVGNNYGFTEGAAFNLLIFIIFELLFGGLLYTKIRFNK